MADLILNSKDSFVMDSIEGTLYASPRDNLTFLNFDNDIKVVARSDWKKATLLAKLFNMFLHLRKVYPFPHLLKHFPNANMTF